MLHLKKRVSRKSLFTILGLSVLAVAMSSAGTFAEEAKPDVSEPVTAAPLPLKWHPGLPLNSAPNKLSSSAATELVEAERDKYWLNAKRIVYKSTLELAAQHQTELTRGLRYDKILRGDPRRKIIALTFDDGPHPAYTPQLLAILKQNDVHATFFVVGEQAEKYPDLIRAEVAAGHSVGDHTYDHVSLVKIPLEYVYTEISSCSDVIKSITGKAPKLFRPPGGVYDEQVATAAEALGFKMVLWTDDPGDYSSPGAYKIEARTLDTVSNGGILLLHDGIKETLQVLPQVIQRLKARGFTFVTVDEMLRTDK